MTVIRLIRDGILPGRQICAGAPYVIREEDLDRPAVRRAIRNGRTRIIDCFFVDDQSADQAAELQQGVPVAAVPRQA
jgi:hypothetical protein